MTTAAAVSLEHICSIEDIFHRHLLPFLSFQDVGQLELVSKTLHGLTSANDGVCCWNVLCDRDFPRDNNSNLREAPRYNQNKDSFDSLESQTTWKLAYKKWKFWEQRTCGGAKASHMVESVRLWTLLKQILQEKNLDNVLHSFSPCPRQEIFEHLVAKQAPSSLVAFYSVHGGQVDLRPRSQDHAFFAGLFGSYSCYNDYYSMRLLNISGHYESSFIEDPKAFLIGISPGNPRMFLYLTPDPDADDNDDDDDDEWQVRMVQNHPGNISIRENPPVVGDGGVLAYFKTFVERLMQGVYPPAQILDASETSRGICLFPNAGEYMSCCVTRGIEVRASARWFPGGVMDQISGGLNFGYSLRVRMVESSDNNEDDENIVPKTCQLVGRHWEFMDGNGVVRRVDGEAVIGKQPLFFRQDGKSGFFDLGPAGDGERYTDKVFVYQSQSGPVAGTSPQDTKLACVKGSFSFLPGSIAQPTGPMFHVTVANFSLSIPFPFY
jgi:uncharacterized protein affecting Mg2+/Co2+ transport